ncbi:uncharacterized protein PHACADRAFT_263208 [Phanerochaete carnosa HHB-10118-sp]|uniref:Uncharacterized protein n=1 Tax=Phanerochaete carnosa (strain HHB-10118-sp) TaxID=650164 RepID=K5UN85_PHACS|nr:uncharacterized protein PHACADRAFT_263208 [Phanerochaete carnosa HHB-10118-sp]EKM51196.1 hypothetical protein PHACADRAFT_263208 [Phanerochaete carnosa HHB-10118-sp]
MGCSPSGAACVSAKRTWKRGRVSWVIRTVARLVRLLTCANNAKLTIYSSSDKATIKYCSFDQCDSLGDHVCADVKVWRLSVGAGLPLTAVESITLQLSFADIKAVNTLTWNALRAVVDSPHMHFLRINHFLPHGAAFKVTKRILCSVLRRTQLTWALDSGKLQFWSFYSDSVTSADILSVPTAHTISGTTTTLDITEQAEWLLSLANPYSVGTTREKYLRQLIVVRAGSSGTAPPAVDGTQHTAVEQAQEVDMQGE